MDRKRVLQWVVGAVAIVLVIGLLLGLGGHYVASPKPTPIEEMPVMRLPDDIEEARYIVESRKMADHMAGLSKEDCDKRHQQRLKQLRQIERRAYRSGSRRQ